MKILITGGIGDFIATESHLSREFKKEIEVISLGCFHNLEIKKIIEGCKDSYPNLKEVKFFFSDFINDPIKKVPVPAGTLEQKIEEQEKEGFLNFSMTSSFEKIIAKKTAFNGSCLFENTLADVSAFSLPRDYYVIFPYSLKALFQRQYNEKDWAETLKILDYKKKKGVVITQCELPIPANQNLIILKNQTTISEAIEITKSSQGFIGVDTFAATIAAQMQIYLKVRSTNEKTYEWKKYIYFAPRKNFSFLNRKIMCPKLMI